VLAKLRPLKARRYPGPFFARSEVVQPGADSEVKQNEIEHTAFGDEGRPARQELAGLFLYLASMAGFLFWLLRYGVNV
jgi:hypothetical protein